MSPTLQMNPPQAVEPLGADAVQAAPAHVEEVDMAGAEVASAAAAAPQVPHEAGVEDLGKERQ